VQIQHLAYLAAVAREEHFGRAADACFVSQPTLSAGIRRLEDELGISLVRRGRRYEGLTPEGERMLTWAHRILADVDGMRTDLAAMREGLAGRLRIGVIPTSLPVMTLLTAPLLERHSALDVSIASLTSRSTTSATSCSPRPTAPTRAPARSAGARRPASGCAR
jgi:DNA-binding transcriptional LysR family regulator